MSLLESERVGLMQEGTRSFLDVEGGPAGAPPRDGAARALPRLSVEQQTAGTPLSWIQSRGTPIAAVLVMLALTACWVSSGPPHGAKRGSAGGSVTLDNVEAKEGCNRGWVVIGNDPCKINDGTEKEYEKSVEAPDLQGDPDMEWEYEPPIVAGASKAGSLRSASFSLPLLPGSPARPDPACSAGNETCSKTECCRTAGEQCYEQRDGFGKCRESCNPGPDPTHWDAAPWSCKELGKRAEGEWPCTKTGEDCSSSQCCSEAGTQCYQKDASFATCKVDCYKDAPDMSAADKGKWTCKELGGRAPGESSWVWGACSAADQNCASTRCCQNPGEQCYEQSASPDGLQVFWAACKTSCSKGKDTKKPWEKPWNCKELGMRTPEKPKGGDKVSPWTLDYCSSDKDNCASTRCCMGVDRQCYRKNDTFAQCRIWCNPGGQSIDGVNWACDPLSQRSFGLATKGWPALFCFSLARAEGYETMIMRHQYTMQVGIFECDSAAILSTDDIDFGGLKSLKVEMAEITTSVDGTAGNSKLFVNVWKTIIQDGRWANYAWTIKVDPDAVILPSRIRTHMAPHTGENVFVVNCNLYPGSPNFPMMYGAVEVYSNKAMHAYNERSFECIRDMGKMLPKWGEDYYMTHCLDHIGVDRVNDFTSLGDDRCGGADCSDPQFASFHDFKSLGEWIQCYDAAYMR